MTRRVHLDRLPKARLIAMIRDAEKRAEQWRRLTANTLATTAPPKRRPITPERTREEAQDILARLPIDPHADEHRAILWHETAPKPRPRTPIQHGTVAGYRKERRRAQQPCPECKAAVSQYQRNRQAVAS